MVDLESYDSYRIWIQHLSLKSESTRKIYLGHLKRFLSWVGMNPDELREDKYTEDQEQKPWERNRVEAIVKQYLKHEEDRGLSCRSRISIVEALKSFFKANGLELKLSYGEMPMGCGFGSKVPSHEEIREIVGSMEDLRMKALILALKDSGLRLSDVIKLKWSDLKDYGEGFYGAKIVTQKKGVPARAFFGEETTKALEVLRERRMMGTSKIRPISEEELRDLPLFSVWSKPNQPMKTRYIYNLFARTTKLLNFTDITMHGLRKFWEQNFHAEHPAIKKQFNGRRLTDDERAYWWKTDEELLRIYKTQYGNLKVFGLDTRELRKQQEIIEGQQKQIEALRREVQTLRDNLEAMQPNNVMRSRLLDMLIEQASLTTKELAKLYYRAGYRWFRDRRSGKIIRIQDILTEKEMEEIDKEIFKST